MDTPPETPAWWKEAVFYQIYPRSFADGNGDGVGDLPGLIGKLDYLKRLGVDALWISPIYASPNDDNGYDVSDYLAIQPEYGTLEDFATLSRGLRERGLRVILDQVLNHSSDEHVWFQESRSSRDHPRRNWYIWEDARGFDAAGRPIPPSNWKCAFEGSAWEWDATTQQFYLHLFSRKQPDLDWRNPEVRKALYAVLRTWMERGADGFRLDVINMIAKPAGYPDVPRKPGETAPFLPLNERACNHPPVHDWLHEMHRSVFTGTEAYAVGETWAVDECNTLEFTSYDREELHGAFYFAFHWAGSGREHFENFHRLYLASRGRGWLTVTLGNHDARRSLSKFGDPVHHRHASATLLATWLLTLPATPFLFQGEELGLTDHAFPSIDDYRDIQTVNRYRAAVAAGMAPAEALVSVQGDSRDNSRTPIPWDGSPTAGFGSGTPWIPIPACHRPLHAAAALADPGSIFHGYVALMALRKRVRSLVYGDFTPLVAPTQVLAYRRGAWQDHPAVVVVLNWGSTDQPWPVLVPGDRVQYANRGNIDPLRLRPWEAVIFLAE